jgi:hypothetical protein
MSREPGNVIAVPLKLSGLPEGYCFSSLEDLLKVLQNNLFAEVPDTITNVQVSNLQPTSSQRADVWFRLNSGGKFIGIYMFDGVTWRQVLEAPNQVTWMYGDSADVPEGFQLIDTGHPSFTAPEIAHIKGFYYPAGAGPYTYFAVTYVGF